MKKLSLIALLLVPVLWIAGCKMAELVNVDSAPLGAPENVTLDQVADVIEQAGISRGWTMNRREPGRMSAKIFVNNKHTAIVDITYDTKTFSIIYGSSIDLNYKAGGSVTYIHPNYNLWVKELKQRIQERAKAM